MLLPAILYPHGMGKKMRATFLKFGALFCGLLRTNGRRGCVAALPSVGATLLPCDFCFADEPKFTTLVMYCYFGFTL
jgi:hypothetical protein